MPRNGLYGAGVGVNPERMRTTLTLEVTTIPSKMLEQ